MAENIMETIKQRLLRVSYDDSDELKGASETEIQSLENYAGNRFPQVYRDFLIRFGRCSGRWFRGTESSLNDRLHLNLREPAEALIQESETPFLLPKEAFVFLMTQGYQFAYFLLDQGDDPAVFHYLENEQAPSKISDHLSEYFITCLENCEELEVRRKARATLQGSRIHTSDPTT